MGMRNSTFGVTTAFVLSVSLGAIAFPSIANATENFPPAVQSDLSLKGAPDCSLCHTSGDQGGKGTVNTPFGRSARAHGLVEYDDSALKNALTAMAADGTDSDGDCVGDIAELKAGTNPDVVDNPVTCDAGGGGANAGPTLEEPRYGCGAHVANGGHGETLGAMALTSLVALVFASRRKRSAR
jgi:MYXO-CTERM domain-containing protein